MAAPFSIPPSLAASFGLTPLHFVFMAQVQNTIYSFSQDGEECVLRLTPESHRSFEQIQAELDWVGHLDRQGVPVSSPLPDRGGNLCRPIEIDGRRWSSAAFRRAPGKIGAESAWHRDTFCKWGEITARMHLAAASYRPSQHPRSDWEAFLPSFAPESEEERVAQERLSVLSQKIKALPRTPDHYGLIHSDLHFWNFAIEGERLIIFDFDNCEYHWFLADLGTIVFEASTCIHQRSRRQEFIADFMAQFLTGYRFSRDPGDLLVHLPAFVKLREVQIFLTLSRRWKNREIGPFQKAFFAAIREAVLTDAPFVETGTMGAILEAGKA